jgi:hypothetical protein
MAAEQDHSKREQLVERNADGTLSTETVKRAMKAFRKRLKLTRLDEESRLGHDATTRGTRSQVVGIKPPEQYPAEVWQELALKGRLKSLGHGLFEIAEG